MEMIHQTGAVSAVMDAAEHGHGVIAVKGSGRDGNLTNRQMNRVSIYKTNGNGMTHFHERNRPEKPQYVTSVRGLSIWNEVINVHK